jgi:LPPG:FO 2-phospho-L-lactate transferase
MRVAMLAGGVGGARLATGFDGLDHIDLTVIVNVGDDQETHGLYVSPDLDTVTYTLAGISGPEGWGRADDTFHFNETLGSFGLDNTFRLGDRDLALKIFRTQALRVGQTLSEVTGAVCRTFGIRANIYPATDDRLRTAVRLADGWVTFQEYFVNRGHADDVLDLEYRGASKSAPAPGVVTVLREADLVVIAPSNPPLSVGPILAIPGISDAVRDHENVVAVSPLIGGNALRGPADRVMAALGYPPGNVGVVEAYRGLIRRLVIDQSDQADMASLDPVEVQLAETVIAEREAAIRLAEEIIEG